MCLPALTGMTMHCKPAAQNMLQTSETNHNRMQLPDVARPGFIEVPSAMLKTPGRRAGASVQCPVTLAHLSGTLHLLSTLVGFSHDEPHMIQ